MEHEFWTSRAVERKELSAGICLGRPHKATGVREVLVIKLRSRDTGGFWVNCWAFAGIPVPVKPSAHLIDNDAPPERNCGSHRKRLDFV